MGLCSTFCVSVAFIEVVQVSLCGGQWNPNLRQNSMFISVVQFGSYYVLLICTEMYNVTG